MLIPTSIGMGQQPRLWLYNVLMPLRASCSFQHFHLQANDFMIVRLNAPQGFMLIPTLESGRTIHMKVSVLMPLRASCSFQPLMAIQSLDNLIVLMPLRASCSFQRLSVSLTVRNASNGLNAPQGFMLIPTNCQKVLR